MKALIIILGICLFSCSVPGVKIHYYLLDSHADKLPVVGEQVLPIVLVKPLVIADYLRQPNLVMLLEQHQIHYSLQDVWAESLQTAFHRALLQDLNSSDSHHYISASSPLVNKASRTISIDLAHFYSTDVFNVVTSGQYWLSGSRLKESKQDALSITKYPFYYELDLQQDGFSHAVNQLRATVRLLAKQINQDVMALPDE